MDGKFETRDTNLVKRVIQIYLVLQHMTFNRIYSETNQLLSDELCNSEWIKHQHFNLTLESLATASGLGTYVVWKWSSIGQKWTKTKI